MSEPEKYDYMALIGRYEFKKDKTNDMIIGMDGCHYQNESEAFHYGQLKLCGCGRPEELSEFLLKIVKAYDTDWNDSPIGVSKMDRVVGLVIQNPDMAAEFISHILNNSHLLEHGGSVGGSWTTQRGKQYLEVGKLEDTKF